MSNKTALVVDDSKSARFALRKYLEGQSFKVDTAENAQEAFNFLKTHHPDLIFLDHVMPGTDGFEALHHIKNDPMTVTIPVVICSSNEGEQFVSEARSRGAADVLQKPPSPEQLLRILDNLQRMSAQLRSATPPRQPDTQRVVPPAAPSKVSSIREPDIAIEQAVMKALRTSMPQAPAAPGMPPPSAPAFNPLTTAGFMASAQVPPSAPPPPAAAPPPAPMFNPSATFNPGATGTFSPAATGAFNPSATGAFKVPPTPAPPASSPKADAAFAQHLRDQIETRMKKMTQDLFMQIAELKANIAHLESHERSPEDEQAALQAATQSAIESVQPQLADIQASISNLQPQISNLHAAIGSVQPQLGSLQAGIGNLQARIEVLERNVESSLSEMRSQFDHALQQQAQRMDQQAQRMEQIAQEGRAAAAEEAHTAAERHVMSAASRIADQLADGIRKALGRAA